MPYLSGPSLHQSDAHTTIIVFAWFPTRFLGFNNLHKTYKVATTLFNQKGIGQVGVDNVVSTITSKTPEEVFLRA